MNLNEAIETLNYIVKENPDKKTGLYTACNVIANHICNVIPVDVKITANYDFSDTYKVVEVEEEYYNGNFPIQETNRYLMQIHSVTIWEEEPYEQKTVSYVNGRKKDRIKIYRDDRIRQNYKACMQFAKDVSRGLLTVIANYK